MDEGLDDSANNRLWAADEQGMGLLHQKAVRPMPSAKKTTSGVAVTRGRQLPTRGVLPESQRVTQTSRSLEVSHASPLAPLRPRDRTALEALFENDDAADMALDEIILDVHRYLSRLYPEPCWEDEPYEFLNGYI